MTTRRLRHAGTMIHVDHRSGWLISANRPLERAESRLFGAMHKWEWLNPAGRLVRDGAMGAAAIGLLLASLSGLRLRRRQRKHTVRAATAEQPGGGD